MDDPEEFEHIPWSQLGADAGPSRQRLAYLAAAALLAVAVGAVAARSLNRQGPPPPTTVAAAPATTTPEPGTSPPETPSTPPPPVAYSEADLLAGPPADAPRAAVARAEWFVVDYFTADRDPIGSLDLRKALPAGAELPTLPHDDAGAPMSYVEWARAFRSEEAAPGLFRITVAFRAIVAGDDGAVERLPVRAVELGVAVTTGAEGWAVVDLPSPSPLPVDTGFEPWPAATGAPPPGVAAAALEAAAAWGDAPEVVTGAAAGAAWRVVVTVDGGAGSRWPLVVWVGADGAPAGPPWAAG